MFRIASGCLLIFASLLLTVPNAAAQSPGRSLRQLRQELDAAIEQADYDTAADLAEAILEKSPRDERAAIVLTHVEAQRGNVEAGCGWLRRAAENGYSNYDRARGNPAFGDLRDEPAYDAAIEIIRRNQQEHLERFRKRAEKTRMILEVPPGHDPSKPAPLIIALHGYGSNADDIAGGWRATARRYGAILAAPEAVHRAGRRGYDWQRGDEAAVIIVVALERVRRDHKIDPKRTLLTGFSQGAWISIAEGLRMSDEFPAVLAVGAPFIEWLIPEEHFAAAPKPRFWLLVGMNDRLMPETEAAANALQSHGFELKLRKIDGVGHHFPPNVEAEFSDALEFLWPKESGDTEAARGAG